MSIEKISIGSLCRIPCEWTVNGTAPARVVSFDDALVCVAVKQEFLPNQKYDELFWVPQKDVMPDFQSGNS